MTDRPNTVDAPAPSTSLSSATVRNETGTLEKMNDQLPTPIIPADRRLAAAVPGRIATGETEEREIDFQALIDRGVRAIQPDVGRAGGPTVCRRLSTLAAAHKDVWCLPHSFGTGVNLMASAQWMASAEAAPFMEYPVTPSPLRNDLVIGLPEMVDGHVVIGDRPGLGITLDPATIASHRDAWIDEWTDIVVR